MRTSNEDFLYKVINAFLMNNLSQIFLYSVSIFDFSVFGSFHTALTFTKGSEAKGSENMTVTR